ncbi:MAG: hypothetical protein QM762_13670 [Chryseolinea sp.]
MRFVVFFICFLFSETMLCGQIKVRIYFQSDCDNSIHCLEFELLNLDDTVHDIQSKNGIAIVPSKGKYMLTSHHSWADDRIATFSQTISIDNSIEQTDTLNIPKIKFTWDGVLHGSGYWNYFNCDKLCDGHEVDFYPNGRKRTEGEFISGKPTHIIEYRQNGTKENEFWYVLGTQFYTRVDYFDESGDLG